MDRAARVPVRAMVRRLRLKLGEHADDPTYFFTKPRVEYWMEKGERPGAEEACAVRWAENEGEAKIESWA